MQPVSLEGTKLFSHWISSASFRTRLILNLKKISYEIIPVDILKYDQDSEFFRTLNPNGMIPALVIDGKVITESMAIGEYVEETRKDSGIRLLPDDAFDRAQVRALCEHVNSGVQPLQNLRVTVKVNKDYGADGMKWANYWNQLGLESLEKKLEKTAGKFAFGDAPTLADTIIFPQFDDAFKKFGCKKEDFPVLSRVYDNFLELQEVKDALPENQDGYVENPLG